MCVRHPTCEGHINPDGSLREDVMSLGADEVEALIAALYDVIMLFRVLHVVMDR